MKDKNLASGEGKGRECREARALGILLSFWKTIGVDPVLSRRACMQSPFSRVQLFATLLTVAHQAPLSMGILQARILEWVAMPSSRGSPQPRDQTQASGIAGGFFTV